MLGVFRLARNYATKIVEKCPAPMYDTGCTYCKLPTFPADKQINHDHNLNGTSALPWKHVLVFLHGITDFSAMPSKIEMIPNTLAGEFTVLRKLLSPVHPVIVSNALVPGFNVEATSKQKVYLYPDNKVVEFEMEHLEQFAEHYLIPEPAEAVPETYNPFASGAKKVARTRVDHSELFKESEMDKNLVLICGHTQRDVRCGLLAPILEKEFHKVLEHEKLDDDVKVGLISHVGGHAYAGNVLYFPRDCSDFPVVWYGRVFSESVQGIVKETIQEGRIIKELYRGDL